MSLTYKTTIFRRKLWVTNKPVMLQRGLKEGIDDLVQLARNEDKESSWIYSHDENKWYNFSSSFLDEHYGENGVYYPGGVVTYPFGLINKGRKVTHYHTHTKKGVEKTVKKVIEELYAEGIEFSQESLISLEKVLLKNSYLQAMFPSEGDIETYLGMLGDNPRVDLDFEIVSPFFISNINLDPSQNIDETVQRYIQIIPHLKEGFCFDDYAQSPLVQLAKENCERINQNNIGLRMKLNCLN